jgi:protein phosphatase 1 regulatory subunit 7
LQVLLLRNNLIPAIVGKVSLKAGLNQLPQLIELELYDNKIVKIEGLEGFPLLEVLDLSYNNIKKIENISHLKRLRKLFLLSNKIKKVSLRIARLKTWTFRNYRCSN